MATVTVLREDGKKATSPHDSSRRLCEEIASWRYEQLPEPVVKTVKALMLDVLGVIGGARRAPGIPELNGRLSRWESSGSATGLIGKRRYSPPRQRSPTAPPRMRSTSTISTIRPACIRVAWCCRRCLRPPRTSAA